MNQETRGSNSKNQSLPCDFNDDNQQLFHCPMFKRKTADESLQSVYRLNLCKNCLVANHQAHKCPSNSNSREQGCGQRHNTMLHGANNRYVRSLTSNLHKNSHLIHSRGNGHSSAVISNKVTTKKQTRQQRIKQQIFSMSCQLFYIDKENKIWTNAFVDLESSLTILLSTTAEEHRLQK